MNQRSLLKGCGTSIDPDQLATKMFADQAFQTPADQDAHYFLLIG